MNIPLKLERFLYDYIRAVPLGAVLFFINFIINIM